MKRIVIIFFCLFLFLSLPVHRIVASDTSSPSLSDAVYADLALNGYLDNVSISFYDGKQNSKIALNESKHWIPASTVKLFAAMYAYKLINEKKLSLTDTVTADAKNVVSTEFSTDELPAIQEGDILNIDRLLRQMITQSDNTAFNILLDKFDRQAMTDYIHTLGLTHTAIGSKLNLDTSQEQYEFDVPGYGINTTTSADYTQAFTMIWQGKIPGAKPLLGILKQQKINYMLPLFLPKEVVVAHKHGDLSPLYHDGGIIFGPKNSYVVSIFSNIGDPGYIAHLSELIYTKNYNLVGSTDNANLNKNVPKTPLPSVDPLVAQAVPSKSKVLGYHTGFSQTQQDITASDLGITAKDLSLVKPTVAIPHVFIPADSPWHFLVPVWQGVKKIAVSGTQAKSEVDVETMLLQVAEAKDLAKRNKLQQANAVLRSMQQTMDSIVQSPASKNDAAIQITVQSVSETRFKVLSDNLKGTQGNSRNELIKEIGQQAQNSLVQVQPNIPLAVNATNPRQHPLIGQIIDKTDTSIIVKTAGGQQLTIPLDNQNLTVKTKNLVVNTVPVPTTSTGGETISPSQNPSPEDTHSLSSAAIGTTVALVGSSVGNTFTPTFALLNVPKELVAPEPVSVIKINKRNNTMVISENGVPVQVDVNSQTVIHGSDTNISFTAIKPGDVVLVHGTPLTPITPTTIPLSPTPTPLSNIGITTTPTTIPPASGITQGSQKSIVFTPTPLTFGTKTISAQPSMSIFHGPTLVPTQAIRSPLSPVTTHAMVQMTNPQSVPPIQTVKPQSIPPVQTQPKVIQSTSIQIIQKKEDVAKPFIPATSQPKPQTQSIPQSQPKPQTQSQSQTTVKTPNSTQPPQPTGKK